MLILHNLNIMESLDALEEAKVSVMKRGLGSKRAALAGATAMQIAKQKNPALMRLYMKHNLIRKQLKAEVFAF